MTDVREKKIINKTMIRCHDSMRSLNLCLCVLANTVEGNTSAYNLAVSFIIKKTDKK